MDNIPNNIADSALYKKVKAEADKTFISPTSAYKSAWIVKEYKARGGTYIRAKPAKKGVDRWFKEKWVQVIPYLVNGEIVPCADGPDIKACRPLVRVSKETPITIGELVEKHGRLAVITLASKKNRNPALRIDWVRGTASKV